MRARMLNKKVTARADKIIRTEEWANDSSEKMTNAVIRLLIADGATEVEAYEYLEIT